MDFNWVLVEIVLLAGDFKLIINIIFNERIFASISLYKYVAYILCGSSKNKIIKNA